MSLVIDQNENKKVGEVIDAIHWPPRLHSHMLLACSSPGRNEMICGTQRTKNMKKHEKQNRIAKLE